MIDIKSVFIGAVICSVIWLIWYRSVGYKGK